MEIRELRVGMKFKTMQGVVEIIAVEPAEEFVVGEIDGNVDYVAHNELEEADLITAC
jgi:hypothetical protein